MKMNDDDQNDDLLMNESDEFLLHMTEQLNQELSDITVSEDLIARTLKAVKTEDKKSQDSKLQDKKSEEKSNVIFYDDAKASMEHKRENKPVKKDHSKVFVQLIGVAAACFVLFIGSRVIGDVGFSKKDECKSETACDESFEATSEPQESANTYTSKAEELPAQESEESFTDGAKNDLTYDIQESPKAESGMSDEKTTAGESHTQQDLLASPPNLEEKNAVTVAMDAALKETSDETLIHTYTSSTSEDDCTKLLLLFSSDELSSSSEDAKDEWSEFIIISMDNDTSILYKVGKKEYVVGQTYEVTGLKSETVYKVKDIEQFKKSIDAITNN